MDSAERKHSWVRWTITILVCILLFVIALLAWGGRVLESSDALPTHADAAVVLEGSLIGERARLAGAMQLLRLGVAERVLVTIPKESYWGEPVPPTARRFLESNYGEEAALRVDFCEVSESVDSTLQEAEAISACITDHRWKSIVVVTSNYHTRRAKIIWHKVTRTTNPALQISIDGVDDPEFQARGWWRRRRWAKTWLMEFTKLIWTLTAGR